MLREAVSSLVMKLFKARLHLPSYLLRFCSSFSPSGTPPIRVFAGPLVYCVIQSVPLYGTTEVVLFECVGYGTFTSGARVLPERSECKNIDPLFGTCEMIA